MSIVSEKEQDFNWLLIEVVDSLSTDQQKNLIRAHKGTVLTGSLTGDLVNDCHLVLNTLVATHVFGPDNLDGLKSRLKRLGRDDLIKTCSEYIENTKKTTEAGNELDDFDRQLIKAKAQLSTLVGESTRATHICEEKLQKYRRQEITKQNLQNQFRRLHNIVEKSTEIFKTAISMSGSSLHSNRSDSELLEYAEGQAPVQETELGEATQLYANIPNKQAPVQAEDEEGPYSIVELPRCVTDNLERDNTGDSGVGSSEGNRDEWLEGSKRRDSVLRRREKPIPKPRTKLPTPKLPPPSPGEYSPLLGRDKRHPYTNTIRASSAEDLLSQLQDRAEDS